MIIIEDVKMTDDTKKPLSPDTLAVRTGQMRSPEGEHSELIFATSSYIFLMLLLQQHVLPVMIREISILVLLIPQFVLLKSVWPH